MSVLRRLVQRGLAKVPAHEPVTSYAGVKKRVIKLSRPQFGGVDLDPDLDENAGVAFPLALLYCSGLFCAFVYLLYQQTMKSSSEAFLTLRQTEDLACSEVPNTITQVFQGSYEGMWETDRDYDSAKAIFALEMPGVKINNAQFAARMGVISSKLEYIGKRYSKRPLLFNYVAYTVYCLTDTRSWKPTSEGALIQFRGDSEAVAESETSPAMQFYTNADASIAFKQSVGVAVASSREGVCIGPSPPFVSGTYKDSGLKLELPFIPNKAFMESTSKNNINRTFLDILNGDGVPCLDQFRTKHLASLTYKGEFRDGFISFEFNVRTAILCLALNMDSVDRPLVEIETLNQINSQINQGLIGYLWDDVGWEMDPVWCLRKQDPRWNLTAEQINGPNICFIPLRRNSPTFTLYYPIMSQAYPDMHACSQTLTCRRMACQCPADAEVPECSHPNWFIGFVYGNIQTPLDQMDDDYAMPPPSAATMPVDAPILALALRMQRFLLENPENGDIEMSKYTSPLLFNTFYAFNSYSTADVPLNSFEGGVGFEGYQNNSWARNQTFDEMLRYSWDEICPMCAALVFQFYSGQPRGWFMNTAGVTMKDLAIAGSRIDDNRDDDFSKTMCRNVLSQTDALDKLAAKPPVPLTTGYLLCTRTPWSSLKSSVGGAVAAANFYTAFVWIVLGILGIRLIRSYAGDRLLGRHSKRMLNDAYSDAQAEAVTSFAKAAVRSIERLELQLGAEGKADLNSLREAATKLQLVFQPNAVSNGDEMLAKQLSLRLVESLGTANTGLGTSVSALHSEAGDGDEKGTTRTSHLVDVIPGIVNHGALDGSRKSRISVDRLEIERL